MGITNVRFLIERHMSLWCIEGPWKNPNPVNVEA